MSVPFLSDDWFNAVRDAQAANPDIDVPAELKALTFNMIIPDGPNGQIEFHVNGAAMDPGLVDNPPISLTAPYEVAYKMIVTGDTMAIAAAFMRGKVKVRGDLRQLKAMAAGKGMDGLRVILKEITAPV
ncbi:MAG: hypothetical protein ACPG1C_12130 [Alphaproteobacteria bacterium]